MFHASNLEVRERSELYAKGALCGSTKHTGSLKKAPCLCKSWLHGSFRSWTVILGIKHDFLFINICWAQREVLKTRAWTKCIRKHVWSLLLHKNILSCKNIRKQWRKCCGKSRTSRHYSTECLRLCSLPGQMISSFWRHEITLATVHASR